MLGELLARLVLPAAGPILQTGPIPILPVSPPFQWFTFQGEDMSASVQLSPE
jgi:hypothetical protein